MGLIKNLFTLRGTSKSRDKPQNSLGDSSFSFINGQTTSGKRVTERSAMQMTAVYSCVRILSESVVALPLSVYERKDNGIKEKAIKHPLYFLLHDEPNKEMSSFIFRETLMTHLLLWGNAYAQVIINGKGEVIGLYPLMPDKMKVDRDEIGNIFYEYSINNTDRYKSNIEEATQYHFDRF